MALFDCANCLANSGFGMAASSAFINFPRVYLLVASGTELYAFKRVKSLTDQYQTIPENPNKHR